MTLQKGKSIGRQETLEQFFPKVIKNSADKGEQHRKSLKFFGNCENIAIEVGEEKMKIY